MHLRVQEPGIERAGNFGFGLVQRRQEQAHVLAHPVGHQLMQLGLLPCNLANQRTLDSEHLAIGQLPYQELRGAVDDKRCRQSAGTLQAGLLEHMMQGGPNPVRRIMRQAHALGDPVGSGKPNAPDHLAQDIGVLANLFLGLRTQRLVDLECSQRAQTVLVQKDEHPAQVLVLLVIFGDALGAFLADARNLAQALGRLLDDVEHGRAKGLDQLLRRARPDPRH